MFQKSTVPSNVLCHIRICEFRAQKLWFKISSQIGVFIISMVFCAKSSFAQEEKFRFEYIPEPPIPIPVRLATYRKMVTDGPTDHDRGIGVANLANIAHDLSCNPNKRQEALDLLEKEVMPKLDLTKNVEPGSACSWRNVVYDCMIIYRKLNERAGRQECLRLLQLPQDNADEKWFAIYLQAFLYADYGEYSKAMITLQKIPLGVKYANINPANKRIA